MNKWSIGCHFCNFIKRDKSSTCIISHEISPKNPSRNFSENLKFFVRDSHVLLPIVIGGSKRISKKILINNLKGPNKQNWVGYLEMRSSAKSKSL